MKNWSERTDRSGHSDDDSEPDAGVPAQRPPGDLRSEEADPARPVTADDDRPADLASPAETDVRVAGTAPAFDRPTDEDGPGLHRATDEDDPASGRPTDHDDPAPDLPTDQDGPVDPAHPADMADPPEHPTHSAQEAEERDAPAEPVQSAAPLAEPAQPVSGRIEQLIDQADAERLRDRWRDVQSGFVDDPGAAVSQARELTTEVLSVLSDAVESRVRALGSDSGEDSGSEQRSDTERLRLALHGYRELVNRILGA